jgi:uncharacterized ferredoxin-like protein
MRPVPRLIDSPSRLGEILMAFMVPLFMLRTIDPLLGLAVGAATAIAATKLTLNKPDGYLMHRLYRAGLSLGGLPARRHRRYLP